MTKTRERNSRQNIPIALIGFVIFFVLLAIFFIKSLNSDSNTTPQNQPSTVSESGGTQYIDITAKGGYSPGNITAKANTKTVLRVKTSATFDCSSALVIPSLNYRKNLPPTAVTEIEIPPQEKNAVLKGACAMGMYRFAINFN